MTDIARRKCLHCRDSYCGTSFQAALQLKMAHGLVYTLAVRVKQQQLKCKSVKIAFVNVRWNCTKLQHEKHLLYSEVVWYANPLKEAAVRWPLKENILPCFIFSDIKSSIMLHAIVIVMLLHLCLLTLTVSENMSLKIAKAGNIEIHTCWVKCVWSYSLCVHYKLVHQPLFMAWGVCGLCSPHHCLIIV